MTESIKTLNRAKPFIEVRDRARPNVKFQQGEDLFDRRGNFFAKADVEINLPEPPPPKVTVREISKRTIGTTKSLVQKVTELVVGDKTVVTSEGAAPAEVKRGRGRPPGSKNKTPIGVAETLRKAAQENAVARAAESAAS
jgi:hypothetical protein